MIDPTLQADTAEPSTPQPQPGSGATSEAPVASASAADSTVAKLADLSNRFAAPIPGASPAGENARHDDRREAIRNEVDKLGRPEGERVNWELIYDAGRALLTEKSKDYLVASYFAVAAFMRAGPPGLIEGIAAISALLEKYWENGFPPVDRVRARVNAIDWFVERVGSLREQAPTAAQPGDLQLLNLAAKKLEELVLDRFQDDMPNIYGLRETLQRIELSIAAHGGSTPDPGAAPASTQAPHASRGSNSASPAQAAVTHVSGASSVTASSGASAMAGTPEARLAELGSPFASPIPGGNRAGENARFDERHETIPTRGRQARKADCGSDKLGARPRGGPGHPDDEVQGLPRSAAISRRPRSCVRGRRGLIVGLAALCGTLAGLLGRRRLQPRRAFAREPMPSTGSSIASTRFGSLRRKPRSRATCNCSASQPRRSRHWCLIASERRRRTFTA